MANKTEKRKEVILSIQNRLNKTNVIEVERTLLEKTCQFKQLLSLEILLPNEKVGPFYNGYWLRKINGSNWTFKISKEKGIPYAFYLQILNERMATALGIHTIKSKIVKLSEDSNYYAIMSEDYRDSKYIVKSGADIVLEYVEHLEREGYFQERYGVETFEEVDEDIFCINSLPVIYQALSYHFTKRAGNPEDPYQTKKNNSIVDVIYNELVKRYIYSFVSMQKDFHLGNWEILENDHIAYLTPMYDMEMSFLDSFYDKKNTSLRGSIDKSLTIDEDFLRFINQSEDNKKKVIQFHYMITPIDLLSFMEKRTPMNVEIPPELKKQILAQFTKHFMKIEDLLSHSNKLIKDSK